MGRQATGQASRCWCMFHKEAQGGEKFFEILERLRAEPDRYIDLIELLYVCLALGYEGKYRARPSGQRRLAAAAARPVSAGPRASGPLSGRGPLAALEGRRGPPQSVIRYVPWWVVAVAGRRS